jgi:saccharopine dehydrogenase-like NADP-dependent oxidoreductase
LLTVNSGGSVIADILSRTDETLSAVHIFAAARSQDQVDKISKLDRVHAFLVDLQDKAAVEYAIAKYESRFLIYDSSHGI